MSIELEYAVKKDIRNNSVIRQADARQRAELRRMVAMAGFVVAMLLFSAWQHFGRLEATRRVEQLRADHARELAVNRQLRLNLERLRAPEPLAAQAARLGLRPPTLRETLVIERLHQPTDVGAVVASAR
ncbi:MAG: hypothetical protein ABS36_13360 [Acidobacteria bacterium SCN 69-37]|nr:MAG: hypothetical protein ABS36_13360 [Acidobacteria bacterium SCN 69-37]